MQALFGGAKEKPNQPFFTELENDQRTFHFHSDIELYFVDGGEVEVVVGERKQLLSAGQMSVALSYDPHGYSTPEHSRSSLLTIPANICKEFTEAVKNKKNIAPFILDGKRVEEIKGFARQICKKGTNPIKKAGYVSLVLGTVYDWLVLEEVVRLPETDLASGMLRFISENFKKGISLKDLATRFGYSESYISRYFRDCFKVGFNQYINLLRLKNALLLMKENTHSITYCAMESGFNSMRSFYRCFKGHFGCSPGQWSPEQSVAEN